MVELSQPLGVRKFESLLPVKFYLNDEISDVMVLARHPGLVGMEISTLLIKKNMILI